MSKATTQARKLRLKSEGLCTDCGKSPLVNETHCEPCRQNAAGRMKVTIDERRNNGLCLRCGEPPQEGGSQCDKCALRLAGYTREAKQRVIDAYGGECSCCGESTFEFLSIDHVNNDGCKRRRQHGSGYRFYLWIIKNNFPPDLQLHCFNCNCAKGFYGFCPHTLAKEKTDV